MASFFKSIGRAIGYIFVLPFFLVALVIFAVYGIFVFIYMLFKSIILFFQGKKIDTSLPEDIEAERRLHPVMQTQQPQEQPAPVIVMEREPTPTYIQEVPANYEQLRGNPSSIENRPQVDQIPNEQPVFKQLDNFAPEEEPEPEIDDEYVDEPYVESHNEEEIDVFDDEDDILPESDDDPNDKIFGE